MIVRTWHSVDLRAHFVSIKLGKRKKSEFCHTDQSKENKRTSCQRDFIHRELKKELQHQSQADSLFCSQNVSKRIGGGAASTSQDVPDITEDVTSDEEKTSSSQSQRVPVKRKACSDDGETKKRKVEPSEPAEPMKPTGGKTLQKKEFLEKLKKIVEKTTFLSPTKTSSVKTTKDEEKTSSSQSKEDGRTTPAKRKACSNDDGEAKKRKVEPCEPAEPMKPTGGKTFKNIFLEILRKLVEKSTFLSGTKTSSVKNEDDFEATYMQLEQLGEGGFGCVFSGFRRSDNLQVAIKRISKGYGLNTVVDEHGQSICTEVAVMQKLKDAQLQSADKASPVVLLDWYDLEEEIVLVMERPIPATDLEVYLKSRGGKMEEEEVKMIVKQLIQTAVDLEERHIFHRDIKVENVLIETSSDVPRARLIDFGLSCFTKETSVFTNFAGTFHIAAPESMFGSGYRAEPTTVWQLGVVGYQALHDEQFRTRKFAMNKLKIRQDLSKDCQSFLKKCLRFSPAFRPNLKELLQHPWLIPLVLPQNHNKKKTNTLKTKANHKTHLQQGTKPKSIMRGRGHI